MQKRKDWRKKLDLYNQYWVEKKKEQDLLNPNGNFNVDQLLKNICKNFDKDDDEAAKEIKELEAAEYEKRSHKTGAETACRVRRKYREKDWTRKTGQDKSCRKCSTNGDRDRDGDTECDRNVDRDKDRIAIAIAIETNIDIEVQIEIETNIGMRQRN